MPVDHGSEWDVAGTPFHAVLEEADNGTAPTQRDASLSIPLELVARYDTVHIQPLGQMFRMMFIKLCGPHCLRSRLRHYHVILIVFTDTGIGIDGDNCVGFVASYQTDDLFPQRHFAGIRKHIGLQTQINGLCNAENCHRPAKLCCAVDQCLCFAEANRVPAIVGDAGDNHRPACICPGGNRATDEQGSIVSVW